jgi:hypothetical protein
MTEVKLDKRVEERYRIVLDNIELAATAVQ